MQLANLEQSGYNKEVSGHSENMRVRDHKFQTKKAQEALAAEREAKRKAKEQYGAEVKK